MNRYHVFFLISLAAACVGCGADVAPDPGAESASAAASSPSEQASSPSERAVPSPLSTALEDGAPPLRTPLAAGTYLADRFGVPMTFTVDDAGWEVIELTDQLVAIGIDRPGGLLGEVDFIVIRGVYDPVTSELVDAPADFGEWVASHPDVEVLSDEPVSIGGHSGRRIEAQAAETVRLAPAPAPFEIKVTPRPNEFTTVTVDGTPIHITIYVEVPEFEEDAARLLEGVTFGSE